MDRNIQFTIEFKDKATGAINQMQLSLKDADDLINAVRGSVEGLNADILNSAQSTQAFNSAIDIVRTLNDSISNLVSGYNDYTLASARLEQVMRNTMDASEDEIRSIVDLCAAQQELGVVEDDVTMAGAQELATYLGLSSSLKTLIPVLNDMLAQQYAVNATQESSVAIATMLGKVMEGQTSALSRYGYSFDEAQEKILKFGTEEERAATLAEVVMQSVGGMNEALAKTDAGKQKQLEMAIDGVRDKIGQLTQGALPFLNIASSAGIALMGIGQLTSAMRVMVTAIKSSSVAAAAAAVHDKVLASAKALLSAATNGAAISTGMLTVAVTALYAALTLGVSVAITAIVSALSALSSEASDASEGMGDLSDSTDAFATSSAEARTRIDLETAKLKALIDAHKDTREAVAHLNQEYGKVFGTYSTASRWYDVLKEKSAAYCRQIGYEAQAKILAQKKAEKEMELQGVYDQRNALTRPGSKAYHQDIEDLDRRAAGLRSEISSLGMQFDACAAEMSTASQALADGKGEFDAAAASYDELKNEISLLETQLKQLGPAEAAEIGRLRSKRTYLSQILELREKQLGMESGGGKGDASGKSLIDVAASYKDIANNIAYYKSILESTNQSRVDEIARISEIITKLEQQQDALKLLQSTFSLTAADESSSLDVISKNIAYQQELRKKASASDIAGIDAEIDRLHGLQAAIEDAAFVPMDISSIGTYDELNKQLQGYERKLARASFEERANIQSVINELNRLKDGWDAALLDIPSSPSTLDEYERALSGLNTKLMQASDDERLGIQRTIDQLTLEEEARKRILQLPSIMSMTEGLDALQGNELSIKLGLIGYDTLLEKIQTLKSILNDPLSPITEEQRADIETAISSLSGYANGMDRARDKSEGVASAVSSAGEVMRNMSGLVGQDAAQWMSWGASVMQAIAQAIPSITALITARHTEAGANAEAAVTGAAASQAGIPIAGPALAVAAVASVLAAMASIPRFAEGGLAYGPTLGIFGEYAGASTNPEVIAPLNKLKALIGSGNGTGGVVRFEIEGRKLTGILEKEHRIKSR